MHQVMGYEGVCAMRDMRYERDDCTNACVKADDSDIMGDLG
jgi:hypothetical protein